MNGSLARQVVEALTPAATQVAADTIFWKPFDAAPVVYFVRFLGERAAKVNVKVDPRNPFDPAQAVALLAEVSDARLDSVTEARPLAWTSLALPGTTFELFATVHPSLSNGALSRTTEFMRPQTFGIVPAYRCEFTENDTRDEAAFRLAKVIPWANWSRTPSPALSLRFLRKRTGIKSTGATRLGVSKLEDLRALVKHVATDDGFIEVENFERVRLKLEHDGGRFAVQRGSRRWVPEPDALWPWLEVFLREGVAVADVAKSA